MTTDPHALAEYAEALVFAAPRLPCKPESVRRIVWGCDGHPGRAATEMALEELVARGLADRDLTGRYRARKLPEKTEPTEDWRERLAEVEKAAAGDHETPSEEQKTAEKTPDEVITDAADTEPPGSLLDALVCPGCGARTIEPCAPGCTALDEPIDDEDAEPSPSEPTPPAAAGQKPDADRLPAPEFPPGLARFAEQFEGSARAAFQQAMAPGLVDLVAEYHRALAPLEGETPADAGRRLRTELVALRGALADAHEARDRAQAAASKARDDTEDGRQRAIADLAAKYGDGPLAVISRAQLAIASLPGLRAEVAAAIEQLRHALAGAEALLEDLDRMGGVA